MKKFIFQSILLISLIALGLFLYQKQASLSELPFLPQKPIYGQIEVGDDSFKVEIANTQARRSKGLADKPSIASNEGMLFVFPQQGKYPFWMKGLKYPLDFIWIKGDKVVDVLPNIEAPKPDQSDASLPIFEPKENIDKVLEVNAGSIEKMGIKVGDQVRIKLN